MSSSPATESRSGVTRRVGESSSLHRETIESQAVAAFARAIGAPLDGTVPPTWLTRGRQGEFELLQKLGVPLSSVLHGEQEYEWLGTLRVGMDLCHVTRLAEAVVKRGSKALLYFLKLDTRFTDGPEGRPVACGRTVIVLREELPS
jgi:hypothetical protein